MPLQQSATSSVKAWATVTESAGGTVLAGMNCASCTAVTGQGTFTFITPMSDANYSVIMSATEIVLGATVRCMIVNLVRTTAGFHFGTVDTTGAWVAADGYNFCVLGT
jgi:hypothetical protein